MSFYQENVNRTQSSNDLLDRDILVRDRELLISRLNEYSQKLSEASMMEDRERNNSETKRIVTQLESTMRLAIGVLDQSETNEAKKNELDFTISRAYHALNKYNEVISISNPTRNEKKKHRKKLGSDKCNFEIISHIKITKDTIKFGHSIYQFKNVTGFRAGEIPKGEIPWNSLLTLVVGGALTISHTIGWFLLMYAFYIVAHHFTQARHYGLSLLLNSGHEFFFVIHDKEFLATIISVLSDFMEKKEGDAIDINIDTRQINIQ